MKKTRLVAALAGALALGCAGAALAQAYLPGDVTGILGGSPLFPAGLRTAELDQQSAGQFAKRAPLVAGVYTFTFAAGQYNAVPVCSASEESTTGHYLKITAISASAVTVTSDVTTANTDPADIICVGNPN